MQTSSDNDQNNILSEVHILCVDDDDDSREITAFTLEQAGATVTSVVSGAEALQAMEHLVPDVLISDVGMPTMDGYELMERVRQLPVGKGGDVLAIALTAYAEEKDAQRARVAGFQRYVTKPVEPSKLISVVQKLLAERSS